MICKVSYIFWLHSIRCEEFEYLTKVVLFDTYFRSWSRSLWIWYILVDTRSCFPAWQRIVSSWQCKNEQLIKNWYYPFYKLFYFNFESCYWFQFQILFISGLGFIIGVQRTFRFFFQKHKTKATISFFGGITIVLMGWPLIGMIFELYGFILLFGLV